MMLRMIIYRTYNHLKMARQSKEKATTPSEMYKYYVKEYGNPKGITVTTYISMITEFNNRVMHRILFNGLKFRMGGRLGIMYLAKNKHAFQEKWNGSTRLIWYPPDWAATKKANKRDPKTGKLTIIRHLNEHTDHNLD